MFGVLLLNTSLIKLSHNKYANVCEINMAAL